MHRIENNDQYQAALAELESILDNNDDESNARITQLTDVIYEYEDRINFMGEAQTPDVSDDAS